MLESYNGEIKKLFNTSGQMYRELAIKDKLPSMTNSEAISLLSEHGKLVKRPFLISDAGKRVGFKDEEWSQIFS